MNAIHQHLILVHFPIVLVPTAFVILLLGLWRDALALKRTAMALLVFAALVTVPVFNSGERSEEKVEHIKGVKESTIEDHEEAAETARAVVLVTGALALIAFWGLGRQAAWAGQATTVVLLAAAISAALLGQTGNLGGRIRHPEAFDELKKPPKAADTAVPMPNQELQPAD